MTLFFVCLILVLGANVSSGQRACVWTWNQPTPCVRSVGASGTISVQVNDDPVDGSRIKWIRDGTTVAQREYIAATNSFNVIDAHSRGSSSGTRTSTSLYNLTIDAFQLADNDAELQVDSEGCSIATTPSVKIEFGVKYCDITHFAPTASSLNGTSTCGFNCIVEYTCNSSFALNNFTATCGESAEWSPSASPCNRTCNNSAFSSFAEPADNNIVSAGQDKTFNCTLCNSTFVRICEETGEWNDTNPSCPSACSAGSIQCGTPANNQTLCGGLQHKFNCNSSSDCPTIFNLQCYSNGTWNSTDCDCPEVCSADNIHCGTPVNNQTMCGGMQHDFTCTGLSDCPATATFNLQCYSNGTWNSVDCNCPEDCEDTVVITRSTIALHTTASVAVASKTVSSFSPLPSEPQTRERVVKSGHIILPLICLGPIISDVILVVNTGTVASIAALVFLSITAVCQIIVAVFLFRIPRKLKILFSFCVDITGGLFGWLLVLTANIVLVATDTGSYELNDGGIAGVVLGSVGVVLLIFSTFLSVKLHEVLSLKDPPNSSNRKPNETMTTKTDNFEIHILGKTISMEMWEVQKSDGARERGTTSKTIYYEMAIFGKSIITKAWEEPKTKEELHLTWERRGPDGARTMKVVSETKIFRIITVMNKCEVPKTE